jgi:hypothetical protein
MRQSIFALAALLTLAACANRPQLSQDCAQNAMCAARASEAAFIAASNGQVQRIGATLTLHPRSAAAIAFTDHQAACDAHDVHNCDGYALMGVFPRAGALVVQKFLYEGSTFFLIDMVTGGQTRLNGMPTFSPDGGEFLVAPFDEENDTGRNNLEIWRRSADGWGLEWSHALADEPLEDPNLPAPYQTRVMRWNDGRIVLQFFIEYPEPGRWSGSLTRDSDGWHLTGKSPPGLFPKREAETPSG